MSTAIKALIGLVVLMLLEVPAGIFYVKYHDSQKALTTAQEAQRVAEQNEGTYKGQLATSQADLAQSKEAAKKCSDGTAALVKAAEDARAEQVRLEALNEVLAAQAKISIGKRDAQIAAPAAKAMTCDQAITELRNDYP